MSLRLVSHSIWGNAGNRGQRVRRTLAAISWQLRKRLLRKPSTLKLASGAKFRAHPDCVVSSALVYADWPEHTELMFIRSRLTPEDAVIDVGANVGHVSLLLLDAVDPRAIFAFEPTPFTFGRLSENWRLNGLPEANLAAVALGSASGFVDMPDVDHPETRNSVGGKDLAARTVRVPLRQLDEFRDRWRNHRVGFLKIDVEGYEKDVLAGAADLLAEDRPRLVMFESLGGTLDPEIAAIFEAARYKTFQLGPSGKPECGRLDAQNLFAVPVETAPELGIG
jgi:FkbM family methyltransferase